MATLASTNRVGLYYVAEVDASWGVIPSGPPKLAQIRYTGESLSYKKLTVASAVIRDDRMTDQLARVGFNTDGDINYELAFGSFDGFFINTLCNDPVTVSVVGLSVDIGGTGSTITYTRATGSWITAGVVVGMWIKVTGAATANNNGVKQVTAVTALVLTVAGAIGGGAETGVAVTVKGKMIRNSTLQKSLVIEKVFADQATPTYQAFTGMRSSTMRMEIAAQQIIKGMFGFMGKTSIAASTTVGDGAPTTASPTEVLTGSSHVGTIYVDGVAITNPLRAATIEVNNNLREQIQIGSEAAAGVGYGFCEVKGSIEAYFQDLTVYNRLLNHTATALNFAATDSTGATIIITIPKLFFTDGSPNAGGGNADVMLPLNFQAVRDATTNCVIQLDLLA